LLSLCIACAPANDFNKVNNTETRKVEIKNEPAEFVWPSESEEDLAIYANAETLDLTRPLIKAFVNKMVAEHAFKAEYIDSILAQASNKQSILKAISRPAEKSKEWFEYRPIFLTDKRISGGKKFIATHVESLLAAEQKYGVPKEIITAIIGVETFYGRITGNYKVIDALVTLGFNYPPRAKFFRSELEEFFLLSREEQFNPVEVLGSYAGAMGNGQFISSSYRNYTADGDGDGKRDLWNSWPDAIHSVANYFNRHNWIPGQAVITAATLPETLKSAFTETKVNLKDHRIGTLKSQGISFITELDSDDPALVVVMQQADGPEYFVAFNNFYTITRYNRSPMYALAVHQLSQELAKPVNLSTD